MKKFEVGKTYYSRSICNHECIFTIEVVKRTEKSVTYIYDGKQRRSMIKTDESGEYIKPDRYSMAPTFRADREVEAQEAEEQTTEEQAGEIAKAIVDGIGKDLAAGLVEYYNLVKQLAEDIPGYKLRDTREIKRLKTGCITTPGRSVQAARYVCLEWKRTNQETTVFKNFTMKITDAGSKLFLIGDIRKFWTIS